MRRLPSPVSALALAAALGLSGAPSRAEAPAAPGGPPSAVRLRAIGAFLSGVPVEDAPSDPELQPLIERVRLVQAGTGGTDAEKTALAADVGRLAQDFDPAHPAMPSPDVVNCYRDHLRGRPLSCAAAAPVNTAPDAPSARRNDAAMMTAALRYASALNGPAPDPGALPAARGPAGPPPSGFAPRPAPPSTPRTFLSDVARQQMSGIDAKIAVVNAEREESCASGGIACHVLPYIAGAGRVVQYSWGPVAAIGDLIKDPAEASYQLTIGAFKDDMAGLQKSGGECTTTWSGSACAGYAGDLAVAAAVWNPFGRLLGVERAAVKATEAARTRLFSDAELKTALYAHEDAAAGVLQLTAAELARRRVSVIRGRMVVEGKALEPGNYLYRMDEYGDFYVIREGNDVKHTTLALPEKIVREDLAVPGSVPGVETGKRSAGAGHICIGKGGRPVGLNGNSGHFRTGADQLERVVRRLSDLGAPVPEAGIDRQLGSTRPIPGC